ncbi:CDP-alcohol phosphatidyltransferase family protein [Solwaraspora sp. WMMB335]|uniref:CDP-alcohol phosphatidyltransferase family protein n=1 Tax=Solwaraspora sp. WMMB335 TaxID=3404118 RepID=UPI003B961297
MDGTPHGWVDGTEGGIANVPNLITTIRTVVAVCLGVPAIVTGSAALTGAAIACYWIGDMLDGLVARRMRQETRFGAVYDIVCDRVCSVVAAAALVPLLPSMALPLGIFVVQFVLVDLLLSLAFLRWPVLSPNYFYLIHKQVFRFNWSPLAKAVNTGGLVILVVIAPSPIYPVVFALAVTTVKIASLVAVARIPPARIPPAGAPGAEVSGVRAATS